MPYYNEDDDEDEELADKSYVNNVVSDLISDFLYYDRKEDDTLPRGHIENMIKDGELTVDELIEMFATHLKEGLA